MSNDHPLNSSDLLGILDQAPVQDRERIELAILSFWHSLSGDAAEQSARLAAFAQGLVERAKVEDIQARWNISRPVPYDAYPHGADHFGSVTPDGFVNEYQARPTAPLRHEDRELVREQSTRPCDRPQYGSKAPQWLAKSQAKPLLIGNKKDRLKTKRLLCSDHGLQDVVKNGGGFRLSCDCTRTKESKISANWFENFPVDWKSVFKT